MPDTPPKYGRKRPTSRQGGSAALRDRSAAYRALRASMLAAEPLCRYCRAQGYIAAAVILDHIVALSLGGTNDPANYAPACGPCNAAKALDERNFATKGYDVRDIGRDPAIAEWLQLAAHSPIATR